MYKMILFYQNILLSIEWRWCYNHHLHSCWFVDGWQSCLLSDIGRFIHLYKENYLITCIVADDSLSNENVNDNS